MTWCFCAHLSSKSISHRTDMIDGCLNLSQYLNYIEQLHALQIGFVIVADQMPTQLYPNVEWKHDPQWQTMNLTNGDNDERETRQFGNVWCQNIMNGVVVTVQDMFCAHLSSKPNGLK
eukprot:360147_1